MDAAARAVDCGAVPAAHWTRMDHAASAAAEVPLRDYIAAAIPFFFLAIALEVLISYQKRKGFYRLNDSLNSLTCGSAQVLTSSFIKWLFHGPYEYIFNHYALYRFAPDSTIGWCLCFLAVDFFYYWFHRFSHEVNTFWSAHQVHHSSEEYNLTTALRQSVFQPVFAWMFYLPMAFCIPPSLYHFHVQWNTLYQFWIHTRLIGRMGVLEYVINTPSHHRVHHGRNPEYIDKNYAGTLIIWDKMFGTFEPEREEAVYGITHPPTTWSPLETQIGDYRRVWQLSRRLQGWDRLAVWFRGPGWLPAGEQYAPGPPLATAALYKYNSRPATGLLDLYVVLHFALAMVGLFKLLTMQRLFPFWVYTLQSLSLLWALTSFAAIYDRRPRALAAEAVRVLVAAVGVWHAAGVLHASPRTPLLVAMVLLSWALLFAAHRRLMGRPRAAGAGPAWQKTDAAAAADSAGSNASSSLSSSPAAAPRRSPRLARR